MGLRDTLRESSSMAELLAKSPSERPVVFYAEDSFTHVQYEGYIQRLLAREQIPIHYVTSEQSDPLLVLGSGMTVRHIDQQLPRLFSRLRGSLVVMTMPDLGRFHVPKPDSGLVLYLFHSLNSAHTAYRTGAFDNYDVFACTGPHHVEELTALRRSRGLAEAELAPVGYYKLDRIARDHERWAGHRNTIPEVLLAPSWGDGNLLEAHGEEIVASLRARDMKVTVRPHPQFFHSLYPEGRSVIDHLMSTFGCDPDVEFELSIQTESSFHRADLMISDWSGAAFEFALGTLRPALFIETPPKIFNPDWEALGLGSFENRMRTEVGEVVKRAEVGRIGEVAARFIDNLDGHALELEALRNATVFNFGQSSEAGADLITDLVGRL